eukprot:GHVQ01040620.1.p1 GENE.GHVQ01040620.1~~GHVQ01040620.1.p1  ORF type:complete len:156 (-),score=12.84 GHVQ01040620.1:694-1161(-)
MVRDKERNRHSGSWLRRGEENRLLKKFCFGGLYALVILSGHLVTPCIIPSFPIFDVRSHDVYSTRHNPPSATVPNMRLLVGNYQAPKIGVAFVGWFLLTVGCLLAMLIVVTYCLNLDIRIGDLSQNYRFVQEARHRSISNDTKRRKHRLGRMKKP